MVKHQSNYERITEVILKALEGDVPSWRRPWRTLHNEGRNNLPTNAISGKAYRGLNLILLWQRMDDDPRFVTYNQAKALGGNVKKGEHGTQITYWSKGKKFLHTDPVSGETKEKQGLIMRVYTVFCVSQCENLTKLAARDKKKADDAPAIAEPLKPVSDARVKEFFVKFGIELREGGGKAYYDIIDDYVGMPLAERFTDEDAYAATSLHELGHATGHKDRCNRQFGKRFGDNAYAFEELVAELTATFACAHLNINSSLENHVSYLANWRKILKSDPKAVVTAASKATQACEYLLAKLGTDAVEPEVVEGEVPATGGEEEEMLAHAA